MLYQERDLIVARQPRLRPALASMCKLLGCEISALRQINDIKVDGASFARDKSDEGYQPQLHACATPPTCRWPCPRSS